MDKWKPHDFSEQILGDLKEIYEKGEVKKKKRLIKSPGIKFLVEQTEELLETSERYVKGFGFDEFYEKYYLS